jgi:hypothetical protein
MKPSNSLGPRTGGIALIGAAVLLAYWPSLHGDFILDDDFLITENPTIRSPDGLLQYWFSAQSTDYWPVSNTTWWIEWRLWGQNPTGYHVTNLILHTLDALLLWAILDLLEIPGAFFAALLFAVHPVNVESVAWISQRKNVLSMLFFLLSVLSYLRFDSRSTEQIERGASIADYSSKMHLARYALSLTAFLLAMLSKGSVAVLPALLLLVTWWRYGHITPRDLIRIVPFVLVAIILTAVNILFQRHAAGENIRAATFIERLLGAGAAVWFYLLKALVPVNLAFVYPQWHVDEHDIRWWLALLAIIILTVTLWSQRHRRLSRGVFFAWSFFILALLPVMGFVDVGFMKHSLVADHYQHIALLAVCGLAGAVFAYLYRLSSGRLRPLVKLSMLLVVFGCICLSWQQSKLYAGPIPLYEDTLAKNPDSSFIHDNLGVALARAGRMSEAIEHFRFVTSAQPDNATAHYNYGTALSKMQRPHEAIVQYQEALRLRPNDADACGNLATAYADTGDRKEALVFAQRAIEMAHSQGRLALEEQIQNWLRNYTSGNPSR